MKMKRVLRVITIISVFTAIPVSVYACLVSHVIGYDFIGICTYQALLFLLALKKPGVLFAVPIGTVIGIPLLYVWMMLPFSASDNSESWSVLTFPLLMLLWVICSYTGHTWIKGKLREHISLLSKGNLKEKTKAIILYSRSGEGFLFATFVLIRFLVFVLAEKFWFDPTDSLLMSFIKESVIFLCILAISVFFEGKRIPLRDMQLWYLSDIGMLEQAAIDFTSAKAYLSDTLRCGESFLYGYHTGWIYPCSEVSEFQLHEGVLPRSTDIMWFIKLIIEKKEHVLEGFLPGDENDDNVKKGFKEEVYPLFLQIQKNSHCEFKVFKLNNKEVSPEIFLETVTSPTDRNT